MKHYTCSNCGIIDRLRIELPENGMEGDFKIICSCGDPVCTFRYTSTPYPDSGVSHYTTGNFDPNPIPANKLGIRRIK